MSMKAMVRMREMCKSSVSEARWICTGLPTAHALARYRCSLPGLAGLAGLRRVGPGTLVMISLSAMLD